MAKRGQADTSDTKKRLLDALEKSFGVVSDACKAAGVSRQTFYQYKKEDPGFADAVDAMEDVGLDFAESALYKQIKEGIPSSTIFYLKTKGKKRGYVESILHGGDKENPIQVDIKIRIDDLTSDKPK